MIINSLLDTDLYKLTMMQVVLHQFPGAIVEYRFKCRNKNVDLAPFAQEIQTELNALCELSFLPEELDYLKQFNFFKSDFIDFLRIFKLNSDFVHIGIENGFELSIIGPWLHTILFEIPLLAIISEVYFRNTQPQPNYQQGQHRLAEKIACVKQSEVEPYFSFSDFGTRRRFSYDWQRQVITQLIKELPQQFAGTSNVAFARQFGVKPMGTMAHEYLQACQSLGPRLIYSQKFAFEKWSQEYRGELGIALSDVFGMQAFLNDFDLFFCKLFDGARHDSGDPFAWGDALIEHYQQLRVDPKTKHLVFSDQLDFPKALKLCEYFHQRSKPAFGIGTNLTNDLGYEPLQNVIKMVECNGQPVAKISDAPDKIMCPDESYLTYLKQVFSIN